MHMSNRDSFSEDLIVESAPRVQIGNAADEGARHRDWFIGHFLDERDGLARTRDVEVKWGVHRAGDSQDEWTLNKTATTLSILINGQDLIMVGGLEILLARPGDYALWAPGVPHRWRALKDCTVLTVRWPSAEDDVVESQVRSESLNVKSGQSRR
jgi:hypothetical protein